MKILSKIIYWGIVVFSVIQFIPVNRINKPVKKSENFVEVLQTPHNVREILATSCYDCHSNETIYPDYAYVAPISWSVKHHINEGREHLNFSEWEKFNPYLKKGMLENTVEVLKDASMPIGGYIAYHPEANLTAEQRKLLVSYFEAVLASGNY